MKKLCSMLMVVAMCGISFLGCVTDGDGNTGMDFDKTITTINILMDQLPLLIYPDDPAQGDAIFGDRVSLMVRIAALIAILEAFGFDPFAVADLNADLDGHMSDAERVAVEARQAE